MQSILKHLVITDASMPKSRVGFWQRKFDNNVKRFRKVKAQLEKSGWKTLVIWECETASIRKLSRLLSFLKQNRGAD